MGPRSGLCPGQGLGGPCSLLGKGLGLQHGTSGAERLTAAQLIDLAADLKTQGIGHTPGLGYHEHRFGQAGAVGQLESLHLLKPHMQALG